MISAILRRRIRSTATFVVLGAVTGFLLGLAASTFDQTTVFWSGVRGTSVGVIIGLLFGVGEEFVVPRLSRKLSFLMLNFTLVPTYACVMLMALVFGISTTDPLIHIAVTGLLGLVSCAALWTLVQSATQVDRARRLQGD